MPGQADGHTEGQIDGPYSTRPLLLTPGVQKMIQR